LPEAFAFTTLVQETPAAPAVDDDGAGAGAGAGVDAGDELEEGLPEHVAVLTPESGITFLPDIERGLITSVAQSPLDGAGAGVVDAELELGAGVEFELESEDDGVDGVAPN